MNRRVLCVDDEPAVLQGFRRSLRKRVALSVAESGAEALEILRRDGPFAVVLTDMRMPGMDGLQLLERVGQGWPQTVRMMLTGNNDLETAMNAVNQGAVFRFMTKPCEAAVLGGNLEAGIEQYRLVTAEKELLEKTLTGSVHLLVELMEMMDPQLFKRTRRVCGLVRRVGGRLKTPQLWQIDLAMILARIGEATLPPETRARARRGVALGEDEQQALRGVPTIGARLLRHIPRLETVAQLVEALGEESFDPERAPRGVGLARTVDAFVRLEEEGYEPPMAAEQLQRQGGWDAAALNELQELHPQVVETPTVEQVIDCHIRELGTGMVLLEDLCLRDGRTLMTAGQAITAATLERIRNFHSLAGLQEPVRVRLPGKENKP